jgi:threonine dehydratase
VRRLIVVTVGLLAACAPPPQELEASGGAQIYAKLCSSCHAPDGRSLATLAPPLAGHAVRTPLIANPFLDERVGGRVLLKCENLQRTGSFKFRGAYNALAALPRETRAHGIVAMSSGNHAQGVAEAARLFGVRATIMPATRLRPSTEDRARRAHRHL